MKDADLTRTRAWLREFEAVTKHKWVSTPKLWDAAKRRVRRLPSGLEPAVVRQFYAKLDELTIFPPFSDEMPGEYFEVYGRLRIKQAIAMLVKGHDLDLRIHETAFLFACKNREEMTSFAHVIFDESERWRFLTRQRLIETFRRYVAANKWKIPRFEPLAREPTILEAARCILANEWFLAFHQAFEASYGSSWNPRRMFAMSWHLQLWAACKLVLRLAGEDAVAPGVEPPPF